MAADNPGWRQLAQDPTGLGLEDSSSMRRINQ